MSASRSEMDKKEILLKALVYGTLTEVPGFLCSLVDGYGHAGGLFGILAMLLHIPGLAVYLGLSEVLGLGKSFGLIQSIIVVTTAIAWTTLWAMVFYYRNRSLRA